MVYARRVFRQTTTDGDKTFIILCNNNGRNRLLFAINQINFADNARRLRMYLLFTRVSRTRTERRKHKRTRTMMKRHWPRLPVLSIRRPTGDGDALTSPPTKTRTRIVGARESLLPPRVPRSVSSRRYNAKCHRCCRTDVCYSAVGIAVGWRYQWIFTSLPVASVAALRVWWW